MKKAKYLFAVLVLISFVLSAAAAFANCGECKSTCSNPIGDTIDKTATIKEMQSKPASAIGYKMDMWGRKIPTQTEKSGKW